MIFVSVFLLISLRCFKFYVMNLYSMQYLVTGSPILSPQAVYHLLPLIQSMISVNVIRTHIMDHRRGEDSLWTRYDSCSTLIFGKKKKSHMYMHV
jgi:ribosomal protein L37E